MMLNNFVSSCSEANSPSPHVMRSTPMTDGLTNYELFFIIKFGSIRYFLSNRSIHLSKTFMGTTIMPVLEESPVENDVMYWNKSKAIL